MKSGFRHLAQITIRLLNQSMHQIQHKCLEQLGELNIGDINDPNIYSIIGGLRKLERGIQLY